MSVGVPILTGLDLYSATVKLESVGLVVGTVTPIVDPAVTLGDVAAQSPAAGNSFTAGEAVNLSISCPSVGFDILATVISQYANSPILLTLVQNMAPYFDQTIDFSQFYGYMWNIATAQGFGLDNWGKILGGITRYLNVSGTVVSLSDNDYRTLLYTKALANISRMTAPAFNALLQSLFPGKPCYSQDLGNMEMSLVFRFFLTPTQLAIIEQSGVMPHPAGVQVNIEIFSGNIFGFNGSGLNPFNFGTFNPG